MNNRIYFFTVLVLISTALYSQKPYFQQEVNYNIKVKLNDIDHLLLGEERISYHNNSPDTLSYIYFHLWPNAYKNTETAFAKQMLENKEESFHLSEKKDKGYIEDLHFQVDGQEVSMEYDSVYVDICKLTLNNLLLPSDSIVITTPFKIKIPGGFSRFGHQGQSYQITQWYPKPAVYDKDGWHPMPYLNQGEFYSEFGTFEVEISLPKNYIVGATGELQTDEEIKWLEEKAMETSGKELFEKYDMATPPSSDEMKTLKYIESNIHDFAWFADKRYHVLKDSVQMPGSKEWVITYAMFTNAEAHLWKNSQEYIQDALLYYSRWYGDYPYRYCTAVKGNISAGGAMEYPTITVIGNTNNPLELEEFIMHEVGHNWFYGVLGFNEREHPFLDEGINSFSEYRYIQEKYQGNKKLYELMGGEKLGKFLNIQDVPFGQYYHLSSLFPQSFGVDQPIITSSETLTLLNYGSIIYHKSAVTFYYLFHYLGEEKFNEIMQKFYEEWKFKHPSPKDLEDAFRTATDKDLDWFFEGLLSTNKKLDYKIVAAKNNKVLVKNIGDLASPIAITAKSSNEINFTIWHDGFKKKQWIEVPTLEVEEFVLNDFDLPEYNKQNNVLKTKGLIKRLEPIEVNKLQIINKPWKTQVGLLPSVGWNNYNKLMLGAFLYNPAIPLPKIEYQVIPMYGTGNKQLAGMGKITLHTFPKLSFSERVDFTLSGRQFGNNIDSSASYNKVFGEVTMFIRKKEARSTIRNKFSLSYTNIGDLNSIRKSIFSLTYNLSNNRFYSPFSLDFSLNAIKETFRASTEFNYTLKIKEEKEAVFFRFFGGVVFNQPDVFPYYLSGGSMADQFAKDIHAGRYEEYRNPTFWAMQTTIQQGNFYIYTPLASNLILTGQMKVKIPYIPLYIYGSVGAFDRQYGKEKMSTATNLMYEGGLNFRVSSVYDIYFPVFYSGDIQNELDTRTSNYWQKIRFCIYFEELNLFRFRDRQIK
jgi:hypothetical protein